MSDLKNKSLFLPKSTLSKAPVGRQTARSSRLSRAWVGSGGRGAGPCGAQPAPCCRARGGAERILWNSSIGSASLQLLRGWSTWLTPHFLGTSGGLTLAVGRQEWEGCPRQARMCASPSWWCPAHAPAPCSSQTRTMPLALEWVCCSGCGGGPRDPRAPSRDSQRSTVFTVILRRLLITLILLTKVYSGVFQRLHDVK